MMWAKKVLAPVALATGLGFAALAYAETNDDGQDPQPEQKKGFNKGGFGENKGFGGKNPFGGGFDRKADPKTEPQPEPRRGQPNPGGRATPSDGGLDAWVQTLAAKITDPHDLIRDSARGALVGVGRAALPTLQKLADGDDAAKALAAKRVIAAIEATPMRPEDGRRNTFGPGSPGSPFGTGTGQGGRTGFVPNPPAAFPPGGGSPIPGQGPGGPGGPTPPPGRPGGRGPGEGGETPPVRPM